MCELPTKNLRGLLVEPPTYGANVPATPILTGWPRYIRITDILETGDLISEGIKGIEPKSAQPYLLKEGDILIARSGNTVGKAYIHHDVSLQAAHAGYLIRFRVDKNKADPNFIFHFLHSGKYWSWVKNVSKVAAQPNINAKQYSCLPIPDINPSEQHTIATILETLDNTVQQTQALVAKLKQVKMGMLHDLLTRGLDDNGELRDPVRHPEQFKDSALGRIPKERETPNEWTTVERPLLQQLVAMGWDYLEGNIDYPQKTFRDNFREVLLQNHLRTAVKRINDKEGLDRNRELTQKLIKGVQVARATGSGAPHSRNVIVKFIDFDPDRQDNNRFVAINQFRIDTIGRVGFVIPDVILFVNGIPLVIIECKSPSLAASDDGGFWKPVESGINQLLRYSNQRDDVELTEGVEHLFAWNQLMVSTCYYAARVATYGAGYKHYVEWKDVTPFSDVQVMDEIGRPEKTLRSQEKLVAGMLRPSNLLDILRNFILFTVDEGVLIKICPRYQQYRAVQKAMARLVQGNTKEASNNTRDERGGIIWHTQGSGKSITMVQLVRKIRTLPELCSFKVVVVTDRSSLERQLQETALLTGERVRPDRDDFRTGESKSEQVRRILGEDGPDLVFCMVQKNQDRTGDVLVLEYEIPIPPPRIKPLADRGEYELPENFGKLDAAEQQESFLPISITHDQGQTKTLRQVIRNSSEYPQVNPSDKIIILIDECHRSHTLSLHANLMLALPNAAKIGFTGTPIMNRDRGNTMKIFDDFIDTYSMKQAEADEATVKILYEGRAPLGLVENAAQLDGRVPQKFAEFTLPEQQIIMQKFATKRRVMEAPKLIAVKVKDILPHYVRNILSADFKA